MFHNPFVAPILPHFFFFFFYWWKVTGGSELHWFDLHMVFFSALTADVH